VRAGELDRKVTLLEPKTQLDSSGTGQAVETFVPRGDVWAGVTPLSGREALAAAQRHPETTHRFRMRWRSRADLNEAWRIRHDGRDWNITEILEIGRREGLDVMATASPAENPA